MRVVTVALMPSVSALTALTWTWRSVLHGEMGTLACQVELAGASQTECGYLKNNPNKLLGVLLSEKRSLVSLSLLLTMLLFKPAPLHVLDEGLYMSHLTGLSRPLEFG
ncbi:unnamed protein product [Euphydryas editha]|uniref:Secreted protein n=1 Tax=Euphydryas editha TaxID=104508 RepID=A0AAU9UYT0_EUPED|nr:unnamed protein product [Euphydryas editha]